MGKLTKEVCKIGLEHLKEYSNTKNKARGKGRFSIYYGGQRKLDARVQYKEAFYRRLS